MYHIKTQNIFSISFLFLRVKQIFILLNKCICFSPEYVRLIIAQIQVLRINYLKPQFIGRLLILNQPLFHKTWVPKIRVKVSQSN